MWWGGQEAGRLGQPSLSGVRGVLVLCPGQNGSSEGFLREKEWREFAERESLALAGFRFVSNDDDLKNGRGYFVASRGSGELLEEGLKKAGLAGVPVLLYGFSGGAHFAMSFAAWKPDRVAGFCLYSFAWWSPPPKGLVSPALVVCGQSDGARYGSTFAYFQAGRRQGKPWTWMSLEGLGHEPSPKLDDFVRRYFSCLVRSAEGIEGREALKGRVVAVDNMTEKAVAGDRSNDVGVSLLPCADLAQEWRTLHHP